MQGEEDERQNTRTQEGGWGKPVSLSSADLPSLALLLPWTD